MRETPKEIETPIRICLVIAILAVLAGLYSSASDNIWIWQVEPKAHPVWDVNDMALPSLSDIQALLNRIEPNDRIPEDGRWGPLTKEKWEKVYIEVSAKQ